MIDGVSDVPAEILETLLGQLREHGVTDREISAVKFSAQYEISLAGADWGLVTKQVLDTLRLARLTLWQHLYADAEQAASKARPLDGIQNLPKFPVPTPAELTRFYDSFGEDGWKRVAGTDGGIPIGMIKLGPDILNWYLNLIHGFGRNLKILEIGPGHGELAGILQKEGHQLYAVELSPKNAAVLEKQGIRTFVGDANTELDLPHDFDLVLFVDSIGQMDPERALDQAKKYLKPGGWVFITTPTTNKPMTREDYAATYLVRYPIAYLRQLLAVRGFDNPVQGYVPLAGNGHGSSQAFLQYISAHKPLSGRSEMRRTRRSGTSVNSTVSRSEMRTAPDDSHAHDLKLWDTLNQFGKTVAALEKNWIFGFWNSARLLVRAYYLEQQIAGREPAFQKELFAQRFEKYSDDLRSSKLTVDVLTLVGLVSFAAYGYIAAWGLVQIFDALGLAKMDWQPVARWGAVASSVMFAAVARLIPTVVEFFALRRDRNDSKPAAKSEMRVGEEQLKIPPAVAAEADKKAIREVVRHKTTGVVARIVGALPQLFSAEAAGGEKQTSTWVLARLNGEKKYAIRLEKKYGRILLSLVEDDSFTVGIEGRLSVLIDFDKTLWTEHISETHAWRPVVDAMLSGLNPEQQKFLNAQGYGPRLAELYASARSEMRAGTGAIGEKGSMKSSMRASRGLDQRGKNMGARVERPVGLAFELRKSERVTRAGLFDIEAVRGLLREADLESAQAVKPHVVAEINGLADGSKTITTHVMRQFWDILRPKLVSKTRTEQSVYAEIVSAFGWDENKPFRIYPKTKLLQEIRAHSADLSALVSLLVDQFNYNTKTLGNRGLSKEKLLELRRIKMTQKAFQAATQDLRKAVNEEMRIPWTAVEKALRKAVVSTASWRSEMRRTQSADVEPVGNGFKPFPTNAARSDQGTASTGLLPGQSLSPATARAEMRTQDGLWSEEPLYLDLAGFEKVGTVGPFDFPVYSDGARKILIKHRRVDEAAMLQTLGMDGDANLMPETYMERLAFEVAARAGIETAKVWLVQIDEKIYPALEYWENSEALFYANIFGGAPIHASRLASDNPGLMHVTPGRVNYPAWFEHLARPEQFVGSDILRQFMLVGDSWDPKQVLIKKVSAPGAEKSLYEARFIDFEHAIYKLFLSPNVFKAYLAGEKQALHRYGLPYLEKLGTIQDGEIESLVNAVFPEAFADKEQAVEALKHTRTLVAEALPAIRAARSEMRSTELEEVRAIQGRLKDDQVLSADLERLNVILTAKLEKASAESGPINGFVLLGDEEAARKLAERMQTFKSWAAQDTASARLLPEQSMPPATEASAGKPAGAAQDTARADDFELGLQAAHAIHDYYEAYAHLPEIQRETKLRLGAYAKALRMMQILDVLQPSTATKLDLAHDYFHTRDFQRAHAAAKDVLAREGVTALEKRSAYVLLGDIHETQAWNAARALMKKPWSQSAQAEAERLIGLYEEAATYFRIVLMEYARNPRHTAQIPRATASLSATERSLGELYLWLASGSKEPKQQSGFFLESTIHYARALDAGAQAILMAAGKEKSVRHANLFYTATFDEVTAGLTQSGGMPGLLRLLAGQTFSELTVREAALYENALNTITGNFTGLFKGRPFVLPVAEDDARWRGIHETLHRIKQRLALQQRVQEVLREARIDLLKTRAYTAVENLQAGLLENLVQAAGTWDAAQWGADSPEELIRLVRAHAAAFWAAEPLDVQDLYILKWVFETLKGKGEKGFLSDTDLNEIAEFAGLEWPETQPSPSPISTQEIQNRFQQGYSAQADGLSSAAAVVPPPPPVDETELKRHVVVFNAGELDQYAQSDPLKFEKYKDQIQRLAPWVGPDRSQSYQPLVDSISRDLAEFAKGYELLAKDRAARKSKSGGERLPADKSRDTLQLITEKRTGTPRVEGYASKMERLARMLSNDLGAVRNYISGSPSLSARAGRFLNLEAQAVADARMQVWEQVDLLGYDGLADQSVQIETGQGAVRIAFYQKAVQALYQRYAFDWLESDARELAELQEGLAELLESESPDYLSVKEYLRRIAAAAEIWTKNLAYFEINKNVLGQIAEDYADLVRDEAALRPFKEGVIAAYPEFKVQVEAAQNEWLRVRQLVEATPRHLGYWQEGGHAAPLHDQIRAAQTVLKAAVEQGQQIRELRKTNLREAMMGLIQHSQQLLRNQLSKRKSLFPLGLETRAERKVAAQIDSLSERSLEEYYSDALDTRQILERVHDYLAAALTRIVPEIEAVKPEGSDLRRKAEELKKSFEQKNWTAITEFNQELLKVSYDPDQEGNAYLRSLKTQADDTESFHIFETLIAQALTLLGNAETLPPEALSALQLFSGEVLAFLSLVGHHKRNYILSDALIDQYLSHPRVWESVLWFSLGKMETFLMGPGNMSSEKKRRRAMDQNIGFSEGIWIFSAMKMFDDNEADEYALEPPHDLYLEIPFLKVDGMDPNKDAHDLLRDAGQILLREQPPAETLRRLKRDLLLYRREAASNMSSIEIYIMSRLLRKFPDGAEKLHAKEAKYKEEQAQSYFDNSRRFNAEYPLWDPRPKTSGDAKAVPAAKSEMRRPRRVGTTRDSPEARSEMRIDLHAVAPTPPSPVNRGGEKSSLLPRNAGEGREGDASTDLRVLVQKHFDKPATAGRSAQTAKAALIDFNDLVNFTPEEIREAAIVMSRRPEVRFIIYNADPAHAQILHFKQLLSFRNVDWTQSAGETAYQALGPQIKEGGVVEFSRGRQDPSGGFSAASLKKINRFKLSAKKTGTMAVALSFDPEDPRYRWGILREGDFYVVADALASLAVNFLNQFVFATAA